MISHGAPEEPPASQACGHTVAAFYGFADLEGLKDLQQELQALAEASAIQGTILLAPEGVNGTVSGTAEAIAGLLRRLEQLVGPALRRRLSQAQGAPFHRLKVRLKREIVTMGCPDLRPADRVGTYVEPKDWNALIGDPDTLVIDTRNAYEVAIGSFGGAIDPGTDSFRSFPAWVEQELRPLVAAQHPRAIALFCTGGIRCEKATAHLLEQGFSGVHHLKGGILGYLEEVPQQDSLWQGECYVFDQRVALTHGLQQGSHSLCHACGLPLSPSDRLHPAYREGVSCHHCIDRFSDDDRLRFSERQRQQLQARRQGRAHLGARLPQRTTADGA